MYVGKRRGTAVNPHAPELAQYTRIPPPSNGATEFVYEKPVLYPLQSLLAGGVRVFEQFVSFRPLYLASTYSATPAPVWGAGVPISTDLDMTALNDNPVYGGSS